MPVRQCVFKKKKSCAVLQVWTLILNWQFFFIWPRPKTYLSAVNEGRCQISECIKMKPLHLDSISKHDISLKHWIPKAMRKVLTVQTVLLNLLQLVIQTLFIRNQPAQPLLRLLRQREWEIEEIQQFNFNPFTHIYSNSLDLILSRLRTMKTSWLMLS